MPREVGTEGKVVLLDTGERLYNPTDFASARGLIYDGAKNALAKSFAFEQGPIRVDVTGLDYDSPKELSLQDERKAIMSGGMLGRRLRGDVNLYKDGVLQETKRVTLMNVPHLTERGTFIHGGNDYGRISQFRLKPGVYARVKASGEIESQINPKTGTGRGMRLALDPETANYKLEVGGRSIHFRSLLKGLGEPDENLRAAWGSDVLKRNSEKLDTRAIQSAYEAIVRTKDKVPDATPEKMAEIVREQLGRMMLSRQVVETTLPEHAGGMVKKAYIDEVETAARLIAREEFSPDHDTAVKVAAELESFDPDLSGEEMQDAHEAVYSKTKPRMASMKTWPAKWMQGGNELGWIDWYKDYADGKRTADDERQKRRWRLFKARNGAAFIKNPTPRAAYALRYWAIDPMKLLKGDNARAKLLKEMREYEEMVTKQFDADRS
jgi:DNA-directed RNA polymerase beta subunit